MRNIGCGLMVQRYVYKKRISLVTFTQYTQAKQTGYNFANLYPIMYSAISQYMHNKCMQITPVYGSFYTVYTGPITTTTYNIFKKGNS